MATSSSSINTQGNLQLIKAWEDLKPYAGKTVAVDSSYYFTGTFLGKSEDFYATRTVAAYTFSDIPLAFARVSNHPLKIFEGGIGYHLNQLLKPKAIGSATIVNKTTLERHSPLSVRLASKEELERISKAVSASLAEFSTLFDFADTDNEKENILPTKKA